MHIVWQGTWSPTFAEATVGRYDRACGSNPTLIVFQIRAGDRLHGRKERCILDRHYEEPYKTTEKWATAIRELGGITIHYFQPGIRSEDYAKAFPGHMLYNQTHKYIKKDGEKVGDSHWVIGERGIPDYANPGQWTPGYGKLWQEGYDYTDPHRSRRKHPPRRAFAST